MRRDDAFATGESAKVRTCPIKDSTSERAQTCMLVVVHGQQTPPQVNPREKNEHSGENRTLCWWSREGKEKDTTKERSLKRPILFFYLGQSESGQSQQGQSQQGQSLSGQSKVG